MPQQLVTVAASNLVDSLEQLAAILASETTPALAAAELRRMADELDDLQPKAN